MIRRFTRRLGQVFAALVALAALLALYVEVDGIPRYMPETVDGRVEVTAARVERGRELASLLCVDCHADPQTGRLTGKHLADLPPQFGEIYSNNITAHPDKGVGRWTDGQLRYFLRTGVRPDGQYVPPYMIKLPHASDEDLDAIVAYLRSDDPAVAPADVDPPGVTRVTFLTKALTHTVFKPLPYPTAPKVAPPRSDRVAYGRYLVFTLDCYTCHSADFTKMNVLEPEKSVGYMGGGNAMKRHDGSDIHTPNLTADDETGIGRWSEADFVRALRQGFRPDGRVLSYPMLPKPELDEDEAAAIYAYLRTVPRIRNAVPRPTYEIAGADDGARAYARYGCASCHGDTGAGALADLRRADERYPDDASLRRWIDEAPTLKPGTKMPGWKGVIREEDYPPLLAHVRALGRASGGRHAANVPAR